MGQQALPVDLAESSPPPPRTSYVFSKQQLEENGFPVVESPIGITGIDSSEYFQLFPWPTVSVQDSLSNDDMELPIFAVDCEMVETKMGSELARISVINEELECVCDTYVKPDSPVTDYRTKHFRRNSDGCNYNSARCTGQAEVTAPSEVHLCWALTRKRLSCDEAPPSICH